MIIPLGHEDLRGRRWPWVSIAIIALNCAVFLATHWVMEAQMAEMGRTKLHILLLAANHPDLELPASVKELVDNFRAENENLWMRMQSSQRPLEDEFDVRMRGDEGFDPPREMAALAAHYDELKSASILETYGFLPSQPSAVTYVTSMFLHGGWFHLIFNMWFLWLAGTVIEDRIGRPLYFAFYMVAGFAATATHAAVFSRSIVPVIGASGAVAGLMGAFLVRYFKTKIKLAFIYFLGFIPRVRVFEAPAYILLPLWLAIEVFWALLIGKSSGTAHHAHIGGFIFGVAAAFGLKFTGLEKKMDESIEKEVTWQADPRVVRAGELLEQNNAEGAVAELQLAIQEKPDSLDALNLLVQATWRKQDMPAHKEALAKLIAAQVKAKDVAAAWESYADFRNVGGEAIAPAAWLALCRHRESLEDWEGAAAEYEALAHAHPQDKQAVYALVNAARLRLKKLNQREDAARLYREAQASPVPHLDWDDAIRRGLADATS